MTILHLMAGLDETSGVANAARRFARLQTERGDRAVLLAPAFKWNPIYFGALFAAAALWKAVGAGEIWVHCSWTFPVWYGAALAKLFGKKLVAVPSGSFDPKRLNNHARWKKRLALPLDKWVIRQADEVLALCKDEIEWVKGVEPSARVRFERVPTFYESVPIRRVTGDLLKRENRPLRVLFLGRAEDPLKGVRYLRQAVKEINDRFSVLIKSEKQMDLRIETTIRGAAKEAAWEWCDVLCLPTLSENFGLVVAEALEHGKPVLTTDGAPAWEPREWEPEEVRRKKEEGRSGEKEERKCDGGVVYLRGYREGTEEMRVKLLRDALYQFLAGRGFEGFADK